MSHEQLNVERTSSSGPSTGPTASYTVQSPASHAVPIQGVQDGSEGVHREYLSFDAVIEEVILKHNNADMLDHPNTLNDYLNIQFPGARARFADYQSRPEPGGLGQVYADVLIVRHLEQICESLNISLGSQLPVPQGHVGPTGTYVAVSYFDVLSWLGLSSQTTATRRTLIQNMRKAYASLYSVRIHSRLENADESVYQQLLVFQAVDVNSHLLPLARNATCPPLTHAEYCAATTNCARWEPIIRSIPRRLRVE